LNLVSLTRDVRGELKICPRWPARRIRVDERALHRLRTIQAGLPQGVNLILTRGYEPKANGLGMARRRFRAIGTSVFRLMYPSRSAEIADIFGSNGHDVDGTHVDVSFALHGRRIRMLPLGVFTPPSWQRRYVKRYASVLTGIRAALQQQGFRIHRNATESLQIHCDLID
jgi:hypothetical protein